MKLNKEYKIIIIIIVIIISIGGYYYFYSKEEMLITNQEEQLEIKENKEENINEEIIKDEAEDKKEVIKVHISGAVNKEGVVELDINSRVIDAIEKAEGLSEDANLDQVNLAYKLEDGMKIHIPTKEEINNNYINETYNNIYITNSEDQKNRIETKEQKININKSTQTELETLPGIGPSTALKIINYRKENGLFNSIDELKEVSGIGEAKYNQIKDLITIE